MGKEVVAEISIKGKGPAETSLYGLVRVLEETDRDDRSHRLFDLQIADPVALAEARKRGMPFGWKSFARTSSLDPNTLREAIGEAISEELRKILEGNLTLLA